MRKKTAYLFSIASSRGFSAMLVRTFPVGTPFDEVRDAADRWYEGVSPKKSETSYTLSIKRTTLPNRRDLLKRWKSVCHRYETVRKQKETLAAHLSARN